ncbi:hypothetical protein TNCV_3438321, partial [Trichonephila clavipes]
MPSTPLSLHPKPAHYHQPCRNTRPMTTPDRGWEESENDSSSLFKSSI